ncbi:hypothetical protein AVO45_07825 [Ruegeria marisrubri]|uniref:Chromosome segregation ATPase-like protein n=1 Tax=Ruegeria marisrubri TaxID=1685379 RepID=A0A0X3TQ35_9RHOB|nr:hypothetical protein [Ruegeria marisrubri]KUJ77875.1 hypothetical protein AVO45_07825 [Ruegeria marisrubri]
MGTLLISALLAAFVLFVLAAIMGMVAWRADHAITIKGPMASLGELEAQIAGKKHLRDDLEAEVQKLRETAADYAFKQAEVDALVRQKAELQAEWNQLEDRRQEILALRQETDEAQTALAQVTRDLTEKAAELEQVEARLQKAERLVAQTEQLEQSRAQLEQAVADLRGELSDLQNLKAREAELRERIDRFERDAARLQGEVETFRARRDEAEDGTRAAEERLEQIRAAHTDEAARLASAQTELTRMDAQRAELLAQIEAMKDKAGLAAGGGGKQADPLVELRSLPPVLRDMQGWDEHARETEAEALHRVSVHMKVLGLDYHRRVIRAYHTAMKVNETTQMAVLAGISGTGKSQLPRRYAQAMGIGFLQVPVQPRWDSPQDLMGFYNYIEGKYRPTDLAQALYYMDEWNGPADGGFDDRMLLVLLDEMNLARVEYYFSDFLSRLESRPGIDETDRAEARKDAELNLDIPMPDGQAPRIFPGYNVLFAGTMNEDESTQSLSDKVVDRANVLRFAAPRTIKAGQTQGTPVETRALTRRQWRAWVRDIDTLGSDRPKVEDHVEKMVGHMTALGRPFGHRLGRAIMAYAANYPEDNGHRDLQAALADQVEMRLLPKLRGVEVENLTGPLDNLAGYVEADLGDPDLAQAIRESVRHAEDETGQFVWRGVARG